VCVDHLDHTPFEYQITIASQIYTINTPVMVNVAWFKESSLIIECLVSSKDNARNSPNTRATVRFFLAPRFNENKERYTMVEQRDLFFALDLFTVTNREFEFTAIHSILLSLGM